MRKPVVFNVFGAGLAVLSNGRELYDHHPRFRLWMDLCDRLVEEVTGRSLLSVLFEKDRPRFSTICSLPIRRCCRWSSAWRRCFRRRAFTPIICLATASEDFTAAVVSGVLTLEEGIELTVDLARLMQAKAVPGGMLAILADESLMATHPEAFLRDCRWRGVILRPISW